MKTARINGPSLEGKGKYIVRRSVLLPLLFVLGLSAALFTREQNAAPAVVTITEFSDFQCPFCKRAASVVEQLRQSYGDNVKFVFKQMPLPMHKQAFKAAQASVCAGEQGKFWEYHDRLFATGDLSVDVLNRTSAEVGLNIAAFSQCLESQASRAMVEKDMAEAERLGVRGTPTFFVDDEAVTGTVTLAALKQKIDGVLTKGSTQPPQSIPTTRSPQVGTGSDSNPVNSVSTSASQAAIASPKGASPNTKDQQQAASTTTTAGVTLSTATIDFGYQLVGTPSTQIVETVTNSGNAPLVITDISVSGRDRSDFIPSYSFTLPVRVTPGDSVSINLSFTPALPWRQGTRSARLEIAEKKTSQYVALTGIGATCGGPVPACSSGCADTDGDGLNDAWEIAGGVDLDNNDAINAKADLVLSGANPNKPDIYVQYDWMDYGLNDTPCAADSDCNLDPSHAGETCTGPATPYSANSCVQSCVADADCTGLGPSHIGDKCLQNVCQHTHDPEALSPGALQAVVDAFAFHGFTLHLVRGHAVPHSHVVSFRQPMSGCEGQTVPSGMVGAYAVNLYDLKKLSFDEEKATVFHYSIFGHLSGCDTDVNCGSCPTVKGTSPQFGQTGQAEITGDDFIVSLGHFINVLGGTANVLNLGGTFMHELGHNLGLHHGGGVTAPGTQCSDTLTCQDLPNYKPNYLSVMNYRYQFSGILEGAAVGSNDFRTCTSDADCSSLGHCRSFGSSGICARLDFSNQTLPVAGNTPGALWEDGQLNEPAGLGSGTSDLFDFDDGQCAFQVAATQGPVNWDGVGLPDNPNATADLNSQDHDLFACLIHNQVLIGNTDWGPMPSQSILNLDFQCTPNGQADGVTLKASRNFEDESSNRELTPEMAMKAHVLYPPQKIQIDITPGCDEKTISPGRRGEFSIAVLASDGLDVREVETASLRFHGASVVRTEIRDINGDGKPDLLIVFDQANVKLNAHAKSARLTGWLKSSQVFIGEDRVTVLP